MPRAGAASSTPARSSPGHGPERCVWPQITCGALMPRRRSTSRMPRRPPRRSAGAGQVAVDRAEPDRVERGDRGRVAGAERGGAQRVARAAPRPPARPRRAPTRRRRRVIAPCSERCVERVHPRVERRERGLVVVGASRRRSGSVDDPARHRAGGEALERRHRRVEVGVVAVDRVDVVAQPEAGVGDRHAARARRARRARAASGPASAGRDRAARGRGSPAARSAGGRRSSPRRARGRGCRRRSTSSPSGPSARPRSANNGAGELGRVALRRPRAARARRRGSRAGRRPRRASSSGARSSGRRSRSERFGRAEVQVGDDERRASVRRLGSAPVTAGPGPLDGLLVADFSRVLAGPFAAMTARRPRRRRDQGRAARTAATTRAPGGRRGATARATYYLGLNRNKRSVALDLADEGDRELARELGARADVLIESFRPGLMASLGPRRRHAARGGQPAARLVLGHRVRLLRARGAGCPATTSCCRRWAG